MRRRSKRRGLWLPVLGHVVTEGESEYHWAYARLSTQPLLDNAVPSAQDVISVVPDFSIVEPTLSTEQTLHDQASGNAWKLRRIVGKLHLSTWNTVDGEDPVDGAQWPNVLVKAGFFISRAGDGNQTQPELSAQESDPLGAGNAMNPWIWQKSWILSNPAVSSSSSQQFRSRAQWPTNNTQWPSMYDGPHIDSKMQRFINKEHRLWFVLSATGYDQEFTAVTGSGSSQPRVAGILDVRVYGSLARQRNFSSF